MKLNNWIKFLSDRHASCDSLNSDAALMEYMTRMLLLFLSFVTVPFLFLSAAGWFYGYIPADTVFILFFMTLIFVSGLILVKRGFWPIGSLFPPGIILLSAVYGNLIGGIEAPAMLLYVAAIILAAVLRGIVLMYTLLAVSIISFVSIGLLQRYGYLTQYRTSETAFINRIVVTVSAIIGITLLIRFLILQYGKALQDEHIEVEERKAAESALKESERKYRELVQNANSIILRINKKGEITFCNDFAERFFGYPAGELIGKMAIDTIVPHTDSEGKDLRNIINNILSSPDDYHSNENENITRDGRRVWINWANKPVLNNEGEYIELLCIGNDITPQKRALEEKEKMQLQLIHAQKMEAIGTLTSGLAHDFNNILSGIMGSLSLMSHQLRNENLKGREELDNYIQVAFDSSKRAADMIRKLLILSRKQDIRLTCVDINKSIEHVMEICRNSFPKSVILNVNYSSIPAIVMADPILIEQIFLNFCVNASHAMTLMRKPGEKEGGSLDVSIYSAEKEPEVFSRTGVSSEEKMYVIVEIKDTGVGMDSETRERIFEPFFTVKKKESGTGLGLSMAYSIISQLGGYIEIESEPGRGSLFRIFIPEVKESHDVPEYTRNYNHLVKGSGTILVIDDERPVLAVAEDSLKACGYNVLKASDGLEGLSLFRDNAGIIDAVLLDISMPYMSGFEVFDKLLEIDKNVRVLLSSGYNDDERIGEALSRGAAGFLQKPYTASELSLSISALLKG
ncbi:MAG TPA: response regulator [Spirochaetota bacterium]|nr:response regulator [Spirochaetota bacterium]